MTMKAVDMHCDTIYELLRARRRLAAGEDPEGLSLSLRKNHLHIDLEKMQKGEYLLQNFAMFVNLKRGVDPLQEVLDLYDVYEEMMAENADLIRPVYTYQDIENNRQEGYLSSMLTIEEGAVCKGDLGVLRTLYRLGVRMMTLTWNFPNEIGYPNAEQRPADADENWHPSMAHVDRENGLTEKGREFVTEMERLGMIVDVSHFSDKGFYDVADMCTRPFVASHSDARAVCNVGRNLDDDMIRTLADKGGVTGLNYFGSFLGGCSLADVVKHAKHIVDVGGIECLGLGSDFDGISKQPVEMPDCSCVPLLGEALHDAGFTYGEVDKILGGNVLRLYRECLR